MKALELQCDNCGNTISDTTSVVYCNRCTNEYCVPCFEQYFDLYQGVSKRKHNDDQLLPGTIVANCGWCPVRKVDIAPILMTRKNVPAGACEWCWYAKFRWVHSDMIECPCKMSNCLCRPHADVHGCAHYCLVAAQKSFIAQHPEEAKKCFLKAFDNYSEEQRECLWKTCRVYTLINTCLRCELDGFPGLEQFRIDCLNDSLDEIKISE